MNSIENDLWKTMQRARASINSKTIKENKILLMENDPELKTLDEYITKLKTGELVVDLPDKEENILENFVEVNVILPEIGQVQMYQPQNVVEAKKDEAYKNTVIKRDSDYDEEKENTKQERVLCYSVISLKDSNGMPFELVIDQDGNDVGKITYDERGNPSFEMSPELKKSIDDKIEKSKVLDYIKPEILENEFYYTDIDTFIKAVEEDKIKPESVKDVALRAIAAQKIYDNNFENEEDVDIALTQTPNEKMRQKEIEDLARNLRNKDEDRLEVPENERNIIIDQRENNGQEGSYIPEDKKQILEPNPDRIIIDPDNEKEIDEEENNKKNDSIPEDQRETIEKYCEENGEDISEVRATLIVKDTATLADLTTDKDRTGGINRYGNEVTIIQFSGTAGRPRYIGIQDDVKVCEGEEFDNAMDRLIGSYHRTVGVIEKVEDDKNMSVCIDSTGKVENVPLKGFPRDLSDHEKEELDKKIQKDTNELQYYRSKHPEDKNYIDVLEMQLFNDFIEAGVTPPKGIEEDARTETETEKVDEEQQTEENSENEEEYDPRDPLYKRLFGDKQ